MLAKIKEKSPVDHYRALLYLKIGTLGEILTHASASAELDNEFQLDLHNATV